MSDLRLGELGKHCKKRANRGKSEDGSSSFRSPWYLCDGETDDDTALGEKGGIGEEVEMDPLVVFGFGIMMMILHKLDARSVALARLVSREWLRLASSDKIWAPKCEELWMGKAHIPRISKVPGLSKLAAYSLSVVDYKRTRITRDDLCDHVWEFHFTEEAPNFWRDMDPYWQGTGTMHRYFHPDGSISADPDDEVWGGHECCYTVVTGVQLENGRVRAHYVRVNRWPKLCVKRRGDDGRWELTNHLYHYSSVPDSHKPDGTGPSFPPFCIV